MLRTDEKQTSQSKKTAFVKSSLIAMRYKNSGIGAFIDGASEPYIGNLSSVFKRFVSPELLLGPSYSREKKEGALKDRKAQVDLRIDDFGALDGRGTALGLRHQLEARDPLHRPWRNGFYSDTLGMCFREWMDKEDNKDDLFTYATARSDIEKLNQYRVLYFNQEEAYSCLTITNQDKQLTYSDGVPIDTQESKQTSENFIYVMDLSGNLFVAPEGPIDPTEPNFRLQHPSFTSGERVLCGGKIKIKDGKIIYIDNENGHYTPGAFSLSRLLDELEKRGILAENVAIQVRDQKHFTSEKNYSLDEIRDVLRVWPSTPLAKLDLSEKEHPDPMVRSILFQKKFFQNRQALPTPYSNEEIQQDFEFAKKYFIQAIRRNGGMDRNPEAKKLLDEINKIKIHASTAKIPLLTELMYRSAIHLNNPVNKENNILYSAAIARLKKHSWGKIAAGIALALFGVTLLTIAIIGVVSSAGISTPLSAAVAWLGSKLIAAGASTFTASAIIGATEACVGAVGVGCIFKGLKRVASSERSVEKAANSFFHFKNKTGDCNKIQTREKFNTIYQLYCQSFQAITSRTREAAIESLQKFADQPSPDSEALLYLGVIYNNRNEEKASQFFSKIPTDMLSKYLAKNETASAALIALNTLAKNATPDPDILFILGKWHFFSKFGDVRKAIEIFLQLPKNPEAQFYLAQAYLLSSAVRRNRSAAMYYFRQSKVDIGSMEKKLQDLLYNKESDKIKNLSSGLSGVEDEKTESKLNLGFDDQVIIDFTPSTFSAEALLLADKWNGKRENICHLLHARDLLESPVTYAELKGPAEKSKLRVYIVSHGGPGLDFIAGPSDSYHTEVDQLAKALIVFLGTQNAVINLVGCNVGKSSDDTQDNSFGARLHLRLYELTNKNIPVVARTASVHFFAGAGKFTFTEPDCPVSGLVRMAVGKDTYVKKQPGSKVTFQLNAQNQQIRTDSYALSNEKYMAMWRRDAIQTIEAACDHTSLPNKKILLTEWLAELRSNKPIIEIYNKIETELRKPTSEIFSHNNGLSKFFKRPTNTKIDIEKLLERGALLPMIHRVGIQFAS